MQVPIVENVLKLNDEVAMLNRQTLQDAGVFAVDLLGGPGAGKTTLLEATLERLAGGWSIGVMVGDLTTARDAERLAQYTQAVVQINTGKSCHLDANQVRQAMGRLDLASLDILVIENVGNLICPVGFDLGQDVKVGLFSITEGEDKAAKHPAFVAASDLLLLNKIDILPHFPFDIAAFRSDIRRIRPDAELLEISAKQGVLDGWVDWLREHAAAKRPASASTS